VVSGAAALLLQQRPHLTPDQVKALLMTTASPIPNADEQAQGRGLINLRAAKMAPTPQQAVQTWPRSTGTGSLEGARGSVHVEHDGVVLEGEQDIFGHPWDGQTWSGQTWSGQTWSGGEWNGQTWSGQTWSGDSWTGQTWSGQTWSGQTWSGQTWSGQTWSGQTWSGQTWSGQTWS
jgi:serine protease AprX